MKSRSIKKINYLLAVICILCAFLICLFQWIPKVYAQESTEISENVYHDKTKTPNRSL